MPISKGSILFQIINLFVKARVKQFPVHSLESNQSLTAGLLLPHSGHCSSIIKQHPLPRSTWLYCSMMYPQWSPASEWSYKNTGFSLLEKNPNCLLLASLKDHPFQWVPPETISDAWYNIKTKTSRGNTTCSLRSPSALTQISHSKMVLLWWHYRPYSYY